MGYSHHRIEAARHGRYHSLTSLTIHSLIATAAPFQPPCGRNWPDNALRFDWISYVAAWLGGYANTTTGAVPPCGSSTQIQLDYDLTTTKKLWTLKELKRRSKKWR